MGSSRLPGKVMLPLDSTHVLEHDIRRVSAADSIDEVIVATSFGLQDDIVARYAKRAGATVYRGSEENVLDRMFQAATQSNANAVIRITGDCPLIAPEVIDEVVRRLDDEEVDYCSNILERTFPRGLDVEAFTYESFEHVHEKAAEPHHLEHVTPYYHEHDNLFSLSSITSKEVFDESWMQGRSDLRLTLDESDDYELLREVYENVSYNELLPIRNAVQYIDENKLAKLNENVEQKST